MNFLKFLGTFGKQKVEETGRAINDALASWDPETASQAEIEMMIEKFEKITNQVAAAKAEYNREQAEADAVQKTYDKQKATALRINEAIEKAASEDEKAQLQQALEELITYLEELKPELEREHQEAVEAKEILVELEEIAKSYAKKVKTAKKTLASAKRDMQKAKMREERAKEREKRVKELAGLKASTDDLGSALSAFQRNADKANTSAESSELRSKLLKPEESANQSIIDKFSADAPVTPVNASSRLANL